MNDMISVVIPVYNVEKYLKESLDSVINQTYKNLEIILVDDGSTDNSGKICDEYAQKDDRITVVHQQNSGAGAAKNAGLKLVKGNYLSIIDSDDYIESDMYEKMLSYMMKYDVEIVQCNFCDVYINGKIYPYWKIENHFSRVSNIQFLSDILKEWKCSIFCNKLFKTVLLKDTLFPVGRKIDDEFFTYRLVSRAKKILNTDDVFYNYRMRKSSVMNDSNNDRLISDRTDCFVERYEYISQKFPEIKKSYYYHLSDILLFYQGNTVSPELKKKLKEYIKIYPYKKPSIIKRILKRKKENNELSQSDNINKELILFD